MPDVYATITEAEPAVVEGLVDILELRANDPQQREMREAYLSDIEFPSDARVAEVGCGPGPVARALASRPGVGDVVGVDPSPIFIEGSSLRGIAAISHLSRATRVRCRWRTTRSTSSCSTRRSATFPGPSSRWPRRHGFSLTAASSPSSMATMRRRPARAATSTRFRHAPRPASNTSSTIAGSSAGYPSSCGLQASSPGASGVTATRRRLFRRYMFAIVDQVPMLCAPASHHARGSQHARRRLAVARAGNSSTHRVRSLIARSS